MKQPRTIVWFSHGAASAVSAYIAVKELENVDVVLMDTGSEHPDNSRFFQEVQTWIGQPITVLKSEKYTDIWDVFEKTGWLVGVGGARCTTELKRKLREKYQRPDDIQIFGYCVEELERAELFQERNPEVNLVTPLIDKGITHDECIAMIAKAGIEIPRMYQLGYGHNNCIGCVKGQQGYWNKVRVDFPDVFERMSKMERKIGAAINKSYAGDGKRKKVFLDELHPDAGNYDEEPQMSCDLVCQLKWEDIGNETK